MHSSPVQRAQETATVVASACGLDVHTADELDEIDFGEWTGQRFDELAADDGWQTWNASRSQATAPGGESMVAAQRRAMEHLFRTAREFGGRTVAMVTHCDIIRALVASILGLSLDHILRFDVDPASISRVVAGDWGARVASLNEGA